MTILFYVLLGLMTLISLVGYYNFFTLPKLKKAKPKTYPFISILIPARNEEKNIATLLDSIFRQDYPNFEVIVCDDNSEDNTWKIIQRFLKEHDNIKAIKGEKLPHNWSGKNWACEQLSAKAKGDLFLFIDADVCMEPEAISSAVALMQKKKVKMLSCFPLQKMKDDGVFLVIPLVDWLLLSVVPFDLIYRTSTCKLSVAIGQFLMIDKETYHKMGRHESIHNLHVDDVAIARRLKSMNIKIMTAKSLNLIKCNMYEKASEAVDGVSRSIYNGVDVNPGFYVFSIAGFMILAVTPIVLAIFNPWYLLVYTPILIQRVLTSISVKQNIFLNLLLIPIHTVVFFIVAIRSMYLSVNNKMVWKGRRIYLVEE